MRDRAAQMALREWATGSMPWVLMFQIGLMFVLALWIRQRVRREPAAGPWLWAIFAGALVLRTVLLPLSRHYFDGHEADYFDAWRGRDLSSAMGYRWYPAVATLYRAFGSLVWGDGQLLKAFCLLVALIGLYGVYRLAELWLGAGRWPLLVMALVACDPVHSFWSSSAYNVILPFGLGVWCLYFCSRGVFKQRFPDLVLACLLGVSAVSARIESGLLLIPVAILLLSSLGRLWSKANSSLAIALLPCGVLALFHAVALGLFVKRPEGSDSPFNYAQAMFAQHGGDLSPLAPWDQSLVLVAIALSCVVLLLGDNKGRLLWVFCLGMLIPSHLLHACFDDYSTRHTLFMRLALILMIVGGIQGAFLPISRPRRLLAALGAVCLLISVPRSIVYWAQTSERFYATAQMFFDQEEGFIRAKHVRLGPLVKNCVFVAESGFYSSYPTVSHFEVLDPVQRAKLVEKYDGCVIYVYDLENYQIASRGIWERGDKISKHFKLQLLGKRVRAQVEDYALLYTIELTP